jgi:alpha-beta hydrolase superfamily lysophospholipase
MPARPWRPRAAAALLTASVAIGLGAVALGPAADAATCADVDVVFARGTGEPAGLGSAGTPFVSSLRSNLSGYSVSSYAVDYQANSSQTSAGPGSTDLTDHVTSVASSCPSTRFVLGGYSQGATVVDKSLGITTGTSGGTAIRSTLSSRVASVVVFGNPLNKTRRTIAGSAPAYASKVKEFCNSGDIVCDPAGNSWVPHLAYPRDGSVGSAASFAATLVKAGATPTPTASPTPTTSPSPTSSPTSTPPTPNPYERGPAPTLTSIRATTGAFATSQSTVSSAAASGFGGGTIYYPTSTTAGTFGAVVIAPGYTARQSSIAWLGPRLASQGFVVLTIDTNTTSDQPASRGDQLRAALRYLTTSSSVRARVDAGRLAVMGHSMGGGGSLEATLDDSSLKAAVALTPWDTRKDFSDSRTSTLIIGAQSDTVAPVSSHSEPFYASLPSGLPKAYLELAGASHFAPNSPNTTIAQYSIAWLKRFVDDDSRYSQFLCPAPAANGTISEYRSSCPY